MLYFTNYKYERSLSFTLKSQLSEAGSHVRPGSTHWSLRLHTKDHREKNTTNGRLHSLGTTATINYLNYKKMIRAHAVVAYVEISFYPQLNDINILGLVRLHSE